MGETGPESLSQTVHQLLKLICLFLNGFPEMAGHVAEFLPARVSQQHSQLSYTFILWCNLFLFGEHRASIFSLLLSMFHD